MTALAIMLYLVGMISAACVFFDSGARRNGLLLVMTMTWPITIPAVLIIGALHK